MTDFADASDVTRKVMRANVNANTKPEMVVRRMLHAMGYRYRLHRNDLPGRPDVVFPSRRKVVFVNGCFWHHHDCQKGRLPNTRREFWKAKLEGNKARDLRNQAALESGGWVSLVVWECEIRDPETLRARLESFLDGHGRDGGNDGVG